MPPSVDPAPLVLDACGVLNLAAAMPLDTAGAELGRRLVVIGQAAAEVLYLDDEEDGAPVRTRVDLAALEIVELEPEDLPGYVALAVDLDDGEAATLAAAQARGWPVCTDDRKAIRIAAALRPAVPIVSTASILRSWADQRGLSDAEVGAVLRLVQTRASFGPPPADPEADWWRHCVAQFEEPI